MSLLVTESTTLVAGCLFSTTVNESVLPAVVAVAATTFSVTAIVPPTTETVIPGLSLSLTVVETVVSVSGRNSRPMMRPRMPGLSERFGCRRLKRRQLL